MSPRSRWWSSWPPLALLLAVGSSRITELTRIPSPAIFLVAASVCADLFPDLGSLSIRADQRIVTVALVLILFDGGMHIGLPASARWPAAWCGSAWPARSSPAAVLAVLAHLLFGFDWRAALLVGTALAPTDPAVVFSVLGRREVAGRTGTLLEGESGANDPVGIALMLAILGTSGGGWGAVAHGAGEFALQMVLGIAFGVAGGTLPALAAAAPAAAQRGALPVADGRLRAPGVRRHDARARVRLPGRAARRDPGRRHPRAVQARDRALRLRGREPRRDRGVHRARPVDPDLGRRSGTAAAGPALGSRPCSILVVRPVLVGPADRADPASPRRAGVRAVGRAQGRGADPARHLRRRRGRSPVPTGSTR